MKLFLSILCYCLGALTGLAQGNFINLDFEATLLPTNGHAIAATSDAFPGWTVYRNGVVQSQVGYNGTINFTEISLRSRYAVTPPAGSWNAYFYSDSRSPIDLAIAQTGQIPVGSGSLQFITFSQGVGVPGFPTSVFGVSFNGSPLTAQLSPGPNSGYTIWTVDISAYAGMTGELRFTGTPGNGIFPWDLNLDNIAFLPIPEPSTWALLALGAGTFWWLARTRRRC